MRQLFETGQPVRGIVVCLISAMAILSVPSAASAQEDSGGEGFVLAPMPDLFRQVEGNFPGRILMVELARAPVEETWSYEVKLLTEQGDVLNLTYDAQSLTLVRAAGRGQDDSRGNNRTGRVGDDDDDDDDRESEREDHESERDDSSDDSRDDSSDDSKDDS